jgi:hypothetical protein
MKRPEQISIPNLALLKSQCASQIGSYSRCLTSASEKALSDAETEAKCATGLKELWECCERVVGPK